MFPRAFHLSLCPAVPAALPAALPTALAAALIALPGQAQIQLEGTFLATQECAANKKLRSDNPGNINTEVGKDYVVFGQNKEAATHFWLHFPGAPVTDRRWVSIDCGVAEVMRAGGGSVTTTTVTTTTTTTTTTSSGGVQVEPDSIENVLAASWQPAFCATSAGQTKVECQTQTPDRPDAMQFSIHGLWPDDLDNTSIFPCYCDLGAPVGCRGKRQTVSSIALTDATREKLAVLMPGTQSGLHLHEWSKHGSCYEDFISGDGAGATPEEYYLDTMLVLDQLNASAVTDLFVDNIGQEITGSQIKAAFDEAFGEGAGDRVQVRCSTVRGERLLAELWIGLAGEISPQSDLGALILAAPTTASSTNSSSCSGGLVVAVP